MHQGNGTKQSEVLASTQGCFIISLEMLIEGGVVDSGE